MTTQLSIPKERLEEIVNDPMIDQGSEFAQMARMLLAGMDSEPVAYADPQAFRNFKAGAATKEWMWCKPDAGLSPLYATPPAPAIPDHLELIDKGRLMMLERSHQTLLDYRADSVWYWQGDEDDQPESLSCPVIMSAETLRELLDKSAPPAPVAVPDERVAFETFMEKRFKDSIDRRLAKNGDGEYFAWDMQVAWIVWQARAAMQANVTLTYEGDNHPEHNLGMVNHIGEDTGKAEVKPVTAATVPDGWKLVPVEPTEEMMLHKSGCQHHAWDDTDCAMRQTRRLVWAHMLAAAPAAPEQEV